jgi:hypothetical protein
VVVTFSDCDPAGWRMPVSIARKRQAFSVLDEGMASFQAVRAVLTPDHGLSTRTFTGWLEVSPGGAVSAPHTSRGFVAPPRKNLLLVSNGLLASLAYAAVPSPGRHRDRRRRLTCPTLRSSPANWASPPSSAAATLQRCSTPADVLKVDGWARHSTGHPGNPATWRQPASREPAATVSAQASCRAG